MDVTVNMETFYGPTEVQLAEGQAGVEVLPGSVAVKGPGVLSVGAGGVTGGTLTMTQAHPRHFVTAHDCIRALLDAGREHERWAREAAELTVALDAEEAVLEVQRRAMLAEIGAAGQADSIEYLDKQSECEAYQDALAVVTATSDALVRAEAEARAARENIKVWVAVASLKESGAA
jgi:hypothetical protein